MSKKIEAGKTYWVCSVRMGKNSLTNLRENIPPTQVHILSVVNADWSLRNARFDIISGKKNGSQVRNCHNIFETEKECYEEYNKIIDGLVLSCEREIERIKQRAEGWKALKYVEGEKPTKGKPKSDIII